MTRNELKAALKEFRTQGLTSIKLTVKTLAMQEEYDRLTAPETVTETAPETAPEVAPETAPETAPEVTYHSFRDIIRQRKPLYTFRPKKAQGFKIVKEKRYDQLTPAEWINDTLAFLDDMCIYEDDYIAA
jgi:hypothetical protein